MDFYQEGDPSVRVQYYNLKNYPIETIDHFDANYNIDTFYYEVNKDTLNLYYQMKSMVIKTYPCGDEIRNCIGRNAMQVVIDGVYLREGKMKRFETLIIPGESFYQVSFPLLEIEGVAQKDMAKWYKSFYAIKAIIQSDGKEEVFYYYNPSFCMGARSYERPAMNK